MKWAASVLLAAHFYISIFIILPLNAGIVEAVFRMFGDRR
jgi:hypothetical protein